MELSLTVLIKNYLVYCLIINIFSMNMSLIMHKILTEVKCSYKSQALFEFGTTQVSYETFIFSHFGYCPFVWVFYSRKLNNHKNSMNSVRIVFRFYILTSKDLLNQNTSVSIHQKNAQILATEIFKTKNGLNPLIVEAVLKFRNLTYNFRNAEILNRNSVNSVRYGTATNTCLSAKIQKILLNDYKELTSLSILKCKIKNLEKDECLCR